MVFGGARMLSCRAAVVFGIADLVTAALIVIGVFAALPARWAPVDSVAALLASLMVASSAALLVAAAQAARRKASIGDSSGGATWAPWAQRLARIAAAFALAVGVSLVSALALTASWLSGVYGTVGRGGAIVLVLVAALALPYLVVLPTVQLFWFASASKSGFDASR